jgi:hypothetical protein
MNRSRRATNPGCFNEDGTWKKGAKVRNRSKRYQALARKRRERERRLAAERKRCHGELTNRIIGQGITVKTERLSYRAFQRTFGKSSKVRGAGIFVSTLARKLEAAGGQLIEFGARNTCLSASDGFEPASGRGFALPHVTLGVGAGRSRNLGQNVREAGEVYPQALVSAARAPESDAILEIPDGT